MHTQAVLYDMIRCRNYWTPFTMFARSICSQCQAVSISSTRRLRRKSKHSPAFMQSHTIHTPAKTWSSPNTALYSNTSVTRRLYATFTDLPASTSATSPPPLPKAQISHAKDLYDEQFKQQDEEVTMSPRSQADVDELYRLANPKKDVLSRSHLSTEEWTHMAPPLAYRAEKRSSAAASQRPSHATTLKSKPQSKKWSATHTSNKAVSPRIEPKTISELSFEDFRLQHRMKQGQLYYHWQGTEGEEAGQQPHHQSLLSRYDWRLRNPWRTPDQSQKHAYAGKILYRKQAQATQTIESPEVEAYQEKYRRFIAMEREESEKKALSRLLSGGKQKSDKFYTSVEGTVEQLSGLQAIQSARRHRAYGSASDNAQARYSEAQQDGSIDEFQLFNDRRKLFLFSRPDRQNFPPNTFHKGKMLFIWKCKYDSVLQEWIVPELQNTSMTLQELSRIPARGYVMKEWANQIDILSGDFIPEAGEMYR